MNSFEVPGGKLEEIKALLEAGRWTEPIHTDENVGVADGYQYVIVYRGARVVAADPDVPAWMAEITAALEPLAMHPQ